MELKVVEPAPDAEEIRTGESALEKLRPRLLAIRAERVVSPRTDVFKASLVALGVAGRVNQPEWRALYARLPPELFQMETLDLLEPAAYATMYAHSLAKSAAALFTRARVPASLASQAAALRARMLKAAEYHLGEDEQNRRLLKSIRDGKSHADLMADLLRLADLYRENAALLSKDLSIDAAADARKADRLSCDLQDALGRATRPQQNVSKDLVARAWTFLNDTYEQIARPGRWIFHGRGAEVFVSLLTAGRKPPRRKKMKAPPEPTD
jgi:hypothetical protein